MNVVRPEDGATEIKRAKARLLNEASENFMSHAMKAMLLLHHLLLEIIPSHTENPLKQKISFRPLMMKPCEKQSTTKLKLLQKHINNIMGTWISLKNIEEVDETELSNFQIWSIRQKSQFLHCP